MNKYEVLEIIGEGTYGVVVKAMNKDTREIVAIKKFKESARNFIKRELKMLNTLKSCEFIVSLKEAYRRKEKIYFIFEYVDRSLLQLLQENPNGLSQNICKNLLFQLCKAIEKCHSMDIIHRDIKPENLLIDKNYQLKLCDFGFARPISLQEDSEPYTEYVATRWYRSPELLLFCPYDKPVDIWAIGCIACELTNGRPLFPGSSDLDQIHQIMLIMGPLPDYQLEELRKNGKYIGMKFSKFDRNTSLDKKFSHTMDEKLLDLTKGCLALNPKNRFNINDCLMHSVFESQLKSYVNKKLDNQSLTIPVLKPRQDRSGEKIDKNEKKELKNKKAISLNDNGLYQTSIRVTPVSNEDENSSASNFNFNFSTNGTNNYSNYNGTTNSTNYTSNFNNSNNNNNNISNKNSIETKHIKLLEGRLRTVYPNNHSNEHLANEIIYNSTSSLKRLNDEINHSNNKFISNQISNEKNIHHIKLQHIKKKDEAKKANKNQQFYNDVFHGSSNDLSSLNIDPRNNLVNSTLSNYNYGRNNYDTGMPSLKNSHKNKYETQSNSKRSKSTLENYKNDSRMEKSIGLRKASVTPTNNMESVAIYNLNQFIMTNDSNEKSTSSIDLFSKKSNQNSQLFTSSRLLNDTPTEYKNRKTPELEIRRRNHNNSQQSLQIKFRTNKMHQSNLSNGSLDKNSTEDLIYSSLKISNMKKSPDQKYLF